MVPHSNHPVVLLPLGLIVPLIVAVVVLTLEAVLVLTDGGVSCWMLRV